MFIAGGEVYMVDFIFYSNKRPYKEVQRVPVSLGRFFQCAMLIEDKRTEETKQNNFLLLALFGKGGIALFLVH